MKNEERTVEIINRIVRNVKERISSVGPLSVEEELALSLLKKLYVAKFVRLTRENSEVSENGSKNDEDTQISCSSRSTDWRRSDDSVSNDFSMHRTNPILRVSIDRSESHNQHKQGGWNRDLWKRQCARKKRLEARKNVEPLELAIDEENRSTWIKTVYNELLDQRKKPITIYDTLITTLHCHFVGETWPGLVERYLGRFISDHILLSVDEIKGKDCNRSDWNQLEECQLQVILHIFAMGANSEMGKENLEKVLDILKLISLLPGNKGILKTFLDEEILDSFLDMIPHNVLAQFYKNFGLPTPPELTTNSPKKKEKRIKYDSTVDNEETKFNSTSARIARTRIPTKRFITWEEDGAGTCGVKRKTFKVDSRKGNSKKSDTDRPKRMKSKNCDWKSSETNEKVGLKLVTNSSGNLVVKSAAQSAILVSVRQSPRHHASTRALQSSNSTKISKLLQNSDVTTSNGNSVINEKLLANDSTRLILVKSKRGYVFKSLLKNNGEENVDDSDEDAMKRKKQKISNGGEYDSASLEMKNGCDAKTPLTIDTKSDGNSEWVVPMANSWTSGDGKDGYNLRRRRLFSDGCSRTMARNQGWKAKRRQHLQNTADEDQKGKLISNGSNSSDLDPYN